MAGVAGRRCSGCRSSGRPPRTAGVAWKVMCVKSLSSARRVQAYAPGTNRRAGVVCSKLAVPRAFRRTVAVCDWNPASGRIHLEVRQPVINRLMAPRTKRVAKDTQPDDDLTNFDFEAPAGDDDFGAGLEDRSSRDDRLADADADAGPS